MSTGADITLIRELPASGTAFVLIAIAAAILARRCFHFQRDLLAVKNALRAWLRTGELGAESTCGTAAAAHVWRSLLALQAKHRSVASVIPAYNEAIDFTSRIADFSDHSLGAAEQAIDLLLEKCAPECSAAAVLGQREESGTREIIALRGIPRLEAALLLALEGEEPNGYRTAHGIWDLRAFGIGLSYLVPFRGGLNGVLWLGLRREEATLDTKRRVFMETMARQVAATLSTARRVEERASRSQHERELLLGISHDLRAPGNSALYALRDLLAEDLGELTERQRSRLLIAREALEDQLAMLGDFLDYTKHQHGFLAAESENVELEPILGAAQEIFGIQAARKNLELAVHSDVRVAVHCDAHHLRRILNNLLSNAVKYTSRGGVRVFVEERDDLVEVRVEDTGSGIRECERSLLFREFTRLSNSRGSCGLGLGLALTKALVQLNRGRIFYRPRAEGGSIFGVELPRAQSVAATVSPVRLSTVLVVDDDPAASRGVIRQLRHLAGRLVPASSYGEALELAPVLNPDVLLTDYFLGANTAEDLLGELSRRGHNIPALILSGSSDTSCLERLRAKHHAVWVQKPSTTEELRTALDRLKQASR